MMKTLRFMLFTVLTMLCGTVLAQDNSTTLQWNASGSTALPTALGNDIALTWDRGTASSSNAPKVTSGEIYFNSGNRVTIAGKTEDVTIEKIVFTFGSDGKATLVTCNASGLEESSEGITTSGLVTTWEGEANSLIFRNPSSDTRRRYIKKIEVTYSSDAPVVLAPSLAITQDNIAATYDMDANSTFVVYYENNGTAAAENAKLTLYVNGAENASYTIGELKNGSSGFWNAKYDVTKFEAGEHAVKLTLTADDCEAVNVEKTVTFTKKAPEATFELTAQNFEFQLPLEKFEIPVTVTNTSDINATDVKINLWNNGIVATETIAELTAGATANVNFTIDALAAGEYSMQALTEGNKYGCRFTVNVLAEPETPVYDLAITGISGTIDLANTENYVRVTVENKGNQDLADIAVEVKTKEGFVLGTGTVSAKAGNTSWVDVTIDQTNLEPGDLAVQAVVNVPQETDPTTLLDNQVEGTVTVKAAPLPAAKFQVTTTTPTIETKVGEEMTVKVTVKNVGDAAGAAEVNIIRGTEVLGAAQTTNALEVNAEQELTFTFANPFTTAGNYDLQAMTTDRLYGCYVNVTVAPADEEKVVDIALVDIRGLENINLKNETNAVQVWFTNNSTVDELNATITLMMDNGTVIGTESIAKGESYKSFTLPTENLVAGTQVTLKATLTAANNKEGNLAEVTKTLDVISGEDTEASFTLTADKKIEVLTTDAKVKVDVTVKNNSTVEARNIKVVLTNSGNTLDEQSILVLTEGQSQKVTFEFDNFTAAGQYDLVANVEGTSDVAYINLVVAEPVTDMAAKDITGTIDLGLTSTYLTVAYKNEGTTDVRNAKVTLIYGEGQVLGEGEITFVKAGAEGICSVTFNTAGLTAGTLNVTATITAEGDAKEYNNAVTKEITVNAADAPQATFSIAAENVTVPFGATSFEIKATVKNTSEVDAQGLTVKLLKGITEVETKAINEVLVAGAETDVTFTIAATEEAPFVAGTTAKYYVQVNNQAQAEVTVTFAKEAVEEVKDLAIEAIQGSIDLSATQSNVSVTVKNNGNVNVQNIKVTLTYNGQTLDGAIRNILPGETGSAFFQIPSEGISGETLAVTAAVELEGDATPDNNTKTAELTVKTATADEPTFSVAAADVTVPVGATSFDIVAKIKNTSAVDAQGLTVKLLKGITEVETKTPDLLLASGAETEVTFTVAATEEAPFVAGTTAKYYVQVNNKAQAEVTVTFAKEAETPVIDMALTAIQGLTEINLQTENKVQVWYANNSNVAVENASIEFKFNGEVQEIRPLANIAVGASSYAEFTLSTEGLVAGNKVEIEANLIVDNDKNLDDNSIRKELNIVSGEAIPAPVIALNPVANQEVEAGEQTINVTVGVFNNGNADAQNVEIKVYQAFGTDLATQTVNIKKGESAIVRLSFDYNIQAATTFHVVAYMGTTPVTEAQDFTVSPKVEVATITVAKIDDVEATTEDEVKFTATLKNTSDIDANDVAVGLYQVVDLKYQLVALLRNVQIAANSETAIDFNLGKLDAGKYTYYVWVSKVDGQAATASMPVSVKVNEYVAPVVNVSLTAIQGISNIDLAEGAENAISVWAENTGNVDAEVTFNLMDGDLAQDAQVITIKKGSNGYISYNLSTADRNVGDKVKVVATISVEGNDETAVTTMERDYDVVNSSVATEPTFAIAAENITVAYGAETFDLEAKVTNTSNIDATDVKVYPFYNVALEDEATTFNLKAGASKPVAFTLPVPENAAGKTLTYYVMAPKATAAVNVTFEAAPVEEKVEVSLTAIQGVSKIDLAEGAVNNISVWANNNGNVDATVKFNLKAGDLALDGQSIDIKAGRNGYAEFALPTAELSVGDVVEVVATIAVEGNAETAVTTMTKEFEVINSSIDTEAKFTVVAQDAETYVGEAVAINMTVSNTSTVDAENVLVKIINNNKVIAQATIAELKANTSTDIVIEIPAEGVSFISEEAKTVELQVVVANNKAVDLFNLTINERVAKKTDLAVTAIQGTLSLDVETNYLTVFVENKGTTDATNAAVTLTANGSELGTATVSVKAGSSTMVTIAVAADALTEGELTVTATIDGGLYDVDVTNNSFEKTYTIAPATAQLSYDAAIAKADTGFDVTVTVSNTSAYDAENVEVTLYNEQGEKIGETQTIAKVAANSSENVTFTIDESYAGKSIQVYVAGAGEAKFIKVTETDGILAIKAQYGNDAKVYTINGQRVDNVRKGGLYIVNGKKTVIK